jgi:xylan 1,4-beta-xylosidase
MEWDWFPGPLDASILSDEAGPPGNPNFTGSFIGMCCQDMTGSGRPADFDAFFYRERDYSPDPKERSLPW